MALLFFHKILILQSIFLIQSILTLGVSQLERKLEIIDQNIVNYGRMNFLNQNLNSLPINSPNNNNLNIFDQVKLRKYTHNIIGLQQSFHHTQYNDHQPKNHPQFKNIHSQQAQSERFFQSLKVVSTVGLTSKKFQGLNFYTHLILQVQNQFYSLEGQKIYTFPLQYHTDVKKYPVLKLVPQLMIWSVRNEKIYLANYVIDYSLKYSANCLNIKIFELQYKNKHFTLKQPGQQNLMIEANECIEKGVDQKSIYFQFFTFNTFQGKPSHYIFANKKEVHFYIYSDISQQILLDKNKTVRISEIFNNPVQQIKSVTKINTHLLILTSKNNLLSVNLNTLLISKKSQYLIIYETVPSQFQSIRSIHFNDNDFRLFYTLTDKNIYQYKISTPKIVKKYPLKIQSKNDLTTLKTQNIWILQNYILVQLESSQKRSQIDFQYFMIEKISGNWYEFEIPFSHERKCSKLKNIFLSKNKNSHYIITLACLMRQKHNYLNDSSKNDKKSQFLIVQHLNLQTSNEVNSAGQMGGIDFTKYRLPMIVFSIGLVCYITVKRSNKKSPQKIAYEQKMQQKFQEQVLSTIRREKQRQQALNILKKKK